MKKKADENERVFSYTYCDTEGKTKTITIQVGDRVIVDGKERIATIEYVKQLKSIDSMCESDDRKYKKCKDCLFENDKCKSTDSGDDFDMDPVESLPDMDEYYTYRTNKRRCFVYESGETTKKLEKPLLVLSRLDQILTHDQLELVNDVYNRRISQAEIARKLGVGRTAINNRLAKAKSRIIKELAKEGIGQDYFNLL